MNSNVELKTQRDEYRVTLFKKKLRVIIGAPWLRFYNSIGREHLVIQFYDFRKENRPEIIDRLRRANIQMIQNECPFKFIKEPKSKAPDIWTISIPIDQEALPERSR